MYRFFRVPWSSPRGSLQNGLSSAWKPTAGVPGLIQACNLIDRFQIMIRRKAKTGLDQWIVDARDSLFDPFANGILKDKAAVSPQSPKLGRTARSKDRSQAEASATVDRRNVKEAIIKYASGPILHAETQKGKFDAPAVIIRLTDVPRNRGARDPGGLFSCSGCRSQYFT